MIEQPLAEEVYDFWGMTIEELDAEHIQKPVGQMSITVARWRTLPTAAFRRLEAAYSHSTGEVERLTHDCFVHGPPVLLQALNKPIYCEHEPNAPYAVDPDAPDRVEQFMALWRRPRA